MSNNPGPSKNNEKTESNESLIQESPSMRWNPEEEGNKYALRQLKMLQNTSLAATAWSRQANVSPSEKPDKYRNMLGKSTMNVSDVVNTTHEVAKRSKATKERTKQLAAFVPDFILSDEGQKIPYISSYEAVVLMADVSGFTALTEVYSLKGQGGTDQLTKTLSSYMGPLAEYMLRAGGDIIKYAGDAILAVWKVYDANLYAQTVEKVTDCALYIQEKCGSYHVSDVDVTIRVKLGVGAGRIYQCGIGNQEYHQFVCYGPGVAAASEAEKHCESGDVVLSDDAWRHVEPSHFTYTVKDAFNKKITAIVEFENSDVRGRPMANPLKILRGSKPVTNFDPDTQIRPITFSIIEKKSLSSLEHQLRGFVIPPVLKKLDDDTPLGYLNESRITSICFIKIDLRPFEPTATFGETMMGIVQQAFKYIYKNCTILQGCLSKIIMFDKGLTYLVVFGLPGYIHDNQSAHALKFAYRVKGQLHSIKHVKDVSLGVTSGGTYCGVLGHHLRQEYTVIGRFVNIAARLMCNYPGKVTCDQDTLYHSKLPVNHFSLMEVKQLKGIKNAGNIYEYLGAEAGEDQTVRTFDYPMVGRDAEITYFRKLVDNALLEFEKFSQITRYHQEGNNETAKNNPVIFISSLWILVFEGDIGIGKSRLLSACIHDCEERGVKVFSVSMNALVAAQRMYAIQSLMLQAFGMEEMRTPQEREEHLRKAIGDDTETASSLCLLNDLFHLKFPTHSKFTGADINSRHILAQQVLSIVLRHFYPNDLVVFVIDDGHLVDAICWEYLQYLSKSPTVFSLVSVRRNISGSPRLSDSITKIIYHNKNVRTIRLDGIDLKFSLILACQVMEVAAIPTELESIIMSKSQGIPAWIEQVLKEMLRNGLLKIIDNDSSLISIRGVKMSDVDRKYITQIVPVKKATGRKKLFDFQTEDTDFNTGRMSIIMKAKSDISIQSIQSSTMIQPIRVRKEVIKPESRVCVVKSDTNIGSAPIPGTLKEILLDVFDELGASEQMLLKCACVLGLRFSRAMLTRIVPTYEVNSRKYEFGFRHLLESGVIKCASTRTSGVIIPGSKQNQFNPPEVECFCRFTKEERLHQEDSDDPATIITKSTPKYYNCKFMEFSKETMMEVIYDLLTEDQRKELHLKAAKYLDTSTLLCRLHGGEPSEYQFGFALKTGELGGDNEEALRSAAYHSNRVGVGAGVSVGFSRSKKFSSNSRKDLKGKDKGSKSNVKEKRRNRKGSLAARIDGLKRFYRDGNKIADIELDIIKGLDTVREKTEVHKKQNSLLKYVCVCIPSKHNDNEEAKEWDFVVNELRRKERQDSVDEEDLLKSDELTPNQVNETNNTLAPPTSPAPRTSTDSRRSVRSSKSRTSAYVMTEDETEQRGRSSTIDLRGCTCANLQAKICVEMVKHYRKAEKFGKCITNLLDAAESNVTIGNSGQSLVHLEDAVGLLKSIKKKEITGPNENDDDDSSIDFDGVYIKIDFLNGLSYFELGVEHKARDNFCKALHKLGLYTPGEDDTLIIDTLIMKASSALWRRHHFRCCYSTLTAQDEEKEKDKKKQDLMRMKLRSLSYLHKLFRNERRLEMAVLISLWQAIAAEELSGSFLEIIPAYCSMMETYSLISNHKKAEYYENLALNLIRDTFDSTKQQELMGLLTSADLFNTVASIRLVRGDIATSTEAAYLSLRIAQAIHDNTLSIHVLPLVIKSLLFSLRISEMIEALQKLWYIAEEEEDWGGIAIYYTLCLDLLLNTAYPLEPFYTCENFVTNSDWNADIQMFREYEVQYNMEASLALWYCRFNRWDGAERWKALAESHRPKVTTFLSVSAELKLLEAYLIMVSHFLEKKHYQHFAKVKNSAKDLMKILKKSIKVTPIFQARYLHLNAFYCRIRSRNAECEQYLRKAEKIAEFHSNYLESQWISHNRKVWNESAIPTLKFFWLEHTENHSLDWHQSGKVPWTNIMYSLPLPTWKS